MTDRLNYTEIITTPATFSDHDLVILKLGPLQNVTNGRGYWKVNNTILSNSTFQRHFRQFWAEQDTNDLTLDKWDKLKSHIRQFIIDFSKKKTDITYKRIRSLRKQFTELQK